MDAGEGVRIAAGIAGMAVMVAAFVAAAVYADRQWRKALAAWSIEEDERDLDAEAWVPEYAAARRGPSDPCCDYAED